MFITDIFRIKLCVIKSQGIYLVQEVVIYCNHRVTEYHFFHPIDTDMLPDCQLSVNPYINSEFISNVYISN